MEATNDHQPPPAVKVNKTFIVKFKPPELTIQTVTAATAEFAGDHLVFLNSKGELAALFLLDVVKCWSELP